MADDNTSHTTTSPGFRYMIVRPEKAGIQDLFSFMVSPDRATAAKFIQTSYDADFSGDGHRDSGGGGMMMNGDHRWVIFVSIIVRKIIAVLGKPMEWTGYYLEFLLNLFSLNGNLLSLLSNFLHGKVVMPQRGSETFISAIGHLDGRIDLDKNDLFLKEICGTDSGNRGIQVEIENRGLMDLCMMASKLAYENANVVRNVVNQHWKMHFVDFYNCWNDYQKERSTQVFVFCDKPKDANLILISFRGTEPFDADDWITDFDYSWYEIPKLGKVHMGFLEALGLGNRADTSTFYELLQAKNTEFTFSNSVDPTAGPSEGSASMSSYTDSDETRGVLDKSSDSEGPTSSGGKKTTKKLRPEMAEMTAYFAVRSKLKSLLKEHKNAKFMVTGHSLGGALAILFPTVLVLHEEEEVMKRLLGVHTFGQPRIGNRQLGRYMETHLVRPVPKYLRVVYCNDLVPRMPYDNKTFLYKHFGVCLYYNSLYIQQNVDEEPNRNYFGILYVIPDYMNAGWELIRSFMLGYIHGAEYKEGWLSIMFRMVGLAIPGLSAHCPTDYVNSVRLGRMRNLHTSSS